MGRLGEQAVQARAERREDRREGGGIGPRPLVEHVAERQLAVVGHDQGEPELAQVMAPLFTVAPLREHAPAIGRREVREEIGRVVGEDLRRDVLGGEDALDQPLLDGRDRLEGDDVHLVPEMLAGQRVGGHAQPARQGGGRRPLGDGPLAARMTQPRNRRRGQGRADGQAVARPGPPARRRQRDIDLCGHLKFLGKLPQGVHRAAAYRVHADPIGGLQPREQVIGSAQMGQRPNGGPAIRAGDRTRRGASRGGRGW